MDFEKNVYVVSLFDLYGALLTSKQRQCLQDYLVNDLTLSEISQNLGITRQAVNCNIKESIRILQHFEDALHLASKLNSVANVLSDNRVDQSVAYKILDILKE